MANQNDQSGSKEQKDQKNQQQPDQQKPGGIQDKNQKPGQQTGRKM